MCQKILCVYSILLLMVSCAEKGSSNEEGYDSIAVGSEDKVKKESKPTKNSTCRDQKILKILDNGRNIISKIEGETNKLINWDLSSGQLVDSLSTPLLPSVISRDGSLLIRKVSYRKYQVMNYSYGSNEIFFTITINAIIEPAPEVSFSPNGKYILFKYRPYISGHSKKVAVYSLKYRDIVFTGNYEDILHAKIDELERNIILVVSEKNSKYLVKHDLYSGRIVFKVKFDSTEEINQLDLGVNRILISFQSQVTAYNLFNGVKEFSTPAFYIYDLDQEKEFALINKDREHMEILNIQTGEVQRKIKKEQGVVFSSCQLVSSPLKLVCLDALNSNKIIDWNLEEEKLNSVCF